MFKGFEIENGVLTGYSGPDAIVMIPEGTKRINDYAFEDNKRLRKVVLPDSVIEIGHWAFSGCSALKEVVFSENLKK